MKALNGFKIIVSICLMVVCVSANAILISDKKFKDLGGNLEQPDVTYKRVFLQLRASSFQTQFLSVGYMASVGCTGLWIGDSPDRKYAYILSAAHCFSNKGGTFPTGVAFRGYNGWLVAQDGLVYIPEERNPSSPFSLMTTDIALLKLDKVSHIVNTDGHFLAPPVLNDMGDEASKSSHLVGYGLWGINTGGVRSGWGDSPRGFNRAASMTESTNLANKIMYLGFDGTGRNFPNRWSRSTKGDSGGPVLQVDQFGRYYSVGVMSFSTGTDMGATRISQYKTWIESKAPGVARWRTRDYTNVKGCYWLDPSNGRWRDVTSFFKDEVACKAQDGCSNGGGCYKWDVNR